MIATGKEESGNRHEFGNNFELISYASRLVRLKSPLEVPTVLFF